MSFQSGPAHPFICPICRDALHSDGRSLRCAQNHTFDIARAGYVNLYLGRPHAIAGDNATMLSARRRFLEAGHYRPLSDAIAGRAKAFLQERQAPTILDAGCGEGDHLRAIDAVLEGENATMAGFDFSRDAARLAARAAPGHRYAVADVKRPWPLPDHSVDWLQNIFAPRNPTEMARVLKPDGRLLIVFPGPDHLAGLSRHLNLLKRQPDKRARLLDQLESFSLCEEWIVRREMRLAAEALVDLVRMTPNQWHRSNDQDDEIRALAPLTVTADFRLLLLRAKNSA